MRTKIKKYIVIILFMPAATALFYCIIGSAPYLFASEVPQEYAACFAFDDFYADAVCVDRAVPIESCGERLNAVLRAIAGAQGSIDLVSFFIQEGETTDVILGGILDAADRGVQVRILLDGILFGFSAESGYALGNHPNITVSVYNPVNFLHPAQLHSRLHDKYILVDDKLLLICGGNIGDAYFSAAGYKGKVTLDRMSLIFNTAYGTQGTKSIIYEMKDYFNSMWDMEEVRTLYEDGAGSDSKNAALFREAYARYKEAHADAFDPEGYDYYEATLPANKISLIANPINAGVKAPTAEYALIRLLSSAEESVLIETPYLIADEAFYELFERLSDQGVDCTVVTSSIPGVSVADVLLFSIYIAGRSKVVGTGISLYEHQSDAYKHIKAYVIDGRLSLVGSYNLCNHSYYINTDILIVIDSEAFAQRSTQLTENYIEQSCLVGAQNAYLEGGTEPLEVSSVRYAAFRLLGIILYPIRFLF